ncbi:MAG: murein biosynthesis integral membrane protein MurJ [Patescibacteria group bacterium]|nr:murein biosynthesis integral membrane protein MurJ [Patescibacteria group bacterium]MDD5164149.1 murein biosynthesis integral membrane protein MurJ [Patescibacteria group bacterium]MDD5534517.1 murein biosynthesis integral membrane protein MurJ [Patescibacteria group bacterium]
MFKRFFKLESTVAGGAIIIALFSILSRLLGLLRDRLLSAHFGAGKILDAYYAAFRLPDLVFNTLVLGALSVAFIPVFLEYFAKDKKEAFKVANSLLNILLTAILFLVVVFFIFAPVLTKLMVPGFDLETRLLTIKLTRIMLISILFFTISNIAGSILNSFKKWLAYSLASIMYNLGIIFGIVFLVKKMGFVGLAWGVVLGAFLHLLIQIPSLFKTGYRPQFIFNWRHPAVKKISVLMLPRCFALGIRQFNLIATTFIASSIAVGAVAVYNLAFNLVSFPIGIFGVSLALAVFPVLSQSFIDGDKALFTHQISKTIRRILYLIIPATALFIILKTQIVRLILGTGAFSQQDIILTAQALAWFSISLFSESLIPVFARAFYAIQDTKTPTIIAAVSFVINIIGCIIFGHLMKISGLALAFSISSVINIGLLYFYLNKKIGDFGKKEIFLSFGRIIFVSLAMASFVQIISHKMALLLNLQTFTGVLIQSTCALIGGILFYLIITFILQFPEVEIVHQFVVRKFKFRSKN